jgi:hypothetical protein
MVDSNLKENFKLKRRNARSPVTSDLFPNLKSAIAVAGTLEKLEPFRHQTIVSL